MLLKSISYVIFSTLLSLLPASAIADHNHAEKQYTIGVVPQFEQRKLFRIWQPIINLLEEKTGFGLHLIGSPKIPVFEENFILGKYDFAYMNPYHMLKANRSEGYVPLVRDGSRELRGILVVKKESSYQQVSQLDKTAIAFPAPNALGASLLMRADLATLHNISFVPRYVQTHSSVYLNVVLGQAEAGGGVMSTLNSQPDEVKNKLRVLYETRPMPPHPVSAHPRVPAEDQKLFRKAWLEIAATAEGQELISKIPMHQPVPASIDEYRPMLEWGLESFWIQ